MIFNRAFPNGDPNGKLRSLEKFDFADAADQQRINPNFSARINPKLWTQGATISEDSARKLVRNLLNVGRINPFTKVNEEILDYYDRYLEGMSISTNKVLEKFSAFVFQGDENKLKDQPSLLALKLQAARGAEVTAQDLIQALMKIEL